MSSTNRTCEYVLDSTDPSTWEGSEESCYVDDRELDSEGLWTCPHDVDSGGDLCLYHRPVDEKDDAAVIERLREDTTAPDGDRSTFQCAGAKFGRFEFAGEFSTDKLQLPHAHVADSLDWSGTTVDVSYLDLAGLSVSGPADFSDCTFTGYTSLAGVQFEDEVSFENARFRGPLDIRFGSFGQTASWKGARFDEGGRFSSTTFGEVTTFEEAVFGGDTSFNRTSARGDLSFENATFEREVTFVKLEVHGDAYFENATFEGEHDFSFAEFGDVDSSGIK